MTNNIKLHKMCTRACPYVCVCVCERFVLVGEEQQQEQTEAFSSHERGRLHTEVSVCKTHSYNTFEGGINPRDDTRGFTRVVTVATDEPLKAKRRRFVRKLPVLRVQ